MSEQISYAEASALYGQLEARAAAVRAGTDQRTSRKPRPLVYVLASVALTVGAIVVALTIGGGSTKQSGLTGITVPPPTTSQGLNGILPAPIGSNPFAEGGRRVTLARASDLLGLRVPTPGTPLANPRNLSAIWFSPVGNGSGTRGEVMLDYVSTQIRISIMPANHILTSDARGAFKKEAKELHMSPGALTIDGAPGLADGGDPRNPGFAEIVRGGLDIAVMGHRSAADLITIARSLYSEPAN